MRNCALIQESCSNKDLPDLISFEDVPIQESLSSPSTSSASCLATKNTSCASIQKSCTNSNEDPSDLMSFEDSTIQESFSSTSLSSSSLNTRKSSESHRSRIDSRSDIICIFVSGVNFTVPFDIFRRKLARLPWTYYKDSSRNKNGGGSFHLNTSPELFGLLLNYIASGSFPEGISLTTAEYEEFEPLAIVLGVENLLECVSRGRFFCKGRRRLSSVMNRNNSVDNKNKRSSSSSHNRGNTGRCCKRRYQRCRPSAANSLRKSRSSSNNKRTRGGALHDSNKAKNHYHHNVSRNQTECSVVMSSSRRREPQDRNALPLRSTIVPSIRGVHQRLNWKLQSSGGHRKLALDQFYSVSGSASID